jgi:hypothetical protein
MTVDELPSFSLDSFFGLLQDSDDVFSSAAVGGNQESIMTILNSPIMTCHISRTDNDACGSKKRSRVMADSGPQISDADAMNPFAPIPEFNPMIPMMAEFQTKRFQGDLYTPVWIRGKGCSREGLCSLCTPPLWLRMKQSAYWFGRFLLIS